MRGQSYPHGNLLDSTFRKSFQSFEYRTGEGSNLVRNQWNNFNSLEGYISATHFWSGNRLEFFEQWSGSMNRHLSSGKFQVKGLRENKIMKNAKQCSDESSGIPWQIRWGKDLAAAMAVTPTITIWFPFTLTPGRSIWCGRDTWRWSWSRLTVWVLVWTAVIGILGIVWSSCYRNG